MRRADAAIAVALFAVAGACAGAQGAGGDARGAGANANATAQGASASAQGAGASAPAQGASASASSAPPDDGDITSLPYRLRIDDVHVDEPLAPAPDLVESVTAGVNRLRTRFTMCLELAMRKADGGTLAPGTAVIVYVIAPNGDVASASVERATTSPLLATCLARAGQTTQFAPTAQRVRVSIRFALTSDVR